MFDLTKQTEKKKNAKVVVVYNPNAWAVNSTEKGHMLPAYDWAKVWSSDYVAKRAIESGLLLVPSAE
jgi:beta-galactosidase/beta-glucuronidase